MCEVFVVEYIVVCILEKISCGAHCLYVSYNIPHCSASFAMQVLWMKPNTKDISGNFSRKKANHCKNLLCTFSLYCHFDCHYLLSNYSSGTMMAMMLRTRIEISWLKCLSLPVCIVCKSRSPDMARSRPLRLFSHSSDRFQTSKYLLGSLCVSSGSIGNVRSVLIISSLPDWFRCKVTFLWDRDPLSI